MRQAADEIERLRAALETAGHELTDAIRERDEAAAWLSKAGIPKGAYVPVKVMQAAVASERAAILKMLGEIWREAVRANGHLYDGDYCLRAVTATIKARGMSDK